MEVDRQVKSETEPSRMRRVWRVVQECTPPLTPTASLLHPPHCPYTASPPQSPHPPPRRTVSAPPHGWYAYHTPAVRSRCCALSARFSLSCEGRREEGAQCGEGGGALGMPRQAVW